MCHILFEHTHRERANTRRWKNSSATEIKTILIIDSSDYISQFCWIRIIHLKFLKFFTCEADNMIYESSCKIPSSPRNKNLFPVVLSDPVSIHQIRTGSQQWKQHHNQTWLFDYIAIPVNNNFGGYQFSC